MRVDEAGRPTSVARAIVKTKTAGGELTISCCNTRYLESLSDCKSLRDLFPDRIKHFLR